MTMKVMASPGSPLISATLFSTMDKTYAEYSWSLLRQELATPGIFSALPLSSHILLPSPWASPPHLSLPSLPPRVDFPARAQPHSPGTCRRSSCRQPCPPVPWGHSYRTDVTHSNVRLLRGNNFKPLTEVLVSTSHFCFPRLLWFLVQPGFGPHSLLPWSLELVMVEEAWGEKSTGRGRAQDLVPWALLNLGTDPNPGLVLV